MDPQAALLAARRHLDKGEVSQALEKLLGYYNWRAHGGFEPANGDETALGLAANITDAVEDLENHGK